MIEKSSDHATDRPIQQYDRHRHVRSHVSRSYANNQPNNRSIYHGLCHLLFLFVFTFLLPFVFTHSSTSFAQSLHESMDPPNRPMPQSFYQYPPQMYGPIRQSFSQKPVNQSQLSKVELQELAHLTREMFNFAYDSYMTRAFPADELKPLTGKKSYSLIEMGNNHLNSPDAIEQYEGAGLTLIDSLSTLAVMNNKTELHHAVEQIRELFTNISMKQASHLSEQPSNPSLSFRLDITVNMFEANIRLLGGLLSAHSLLIDPRLGLTQSNQSSKQSTYHYDGVLLTLAQSLGEAFLPAFNTPTGLPYAWVNLMTGIPSNQSDYHSMSQSVNQCSAGIGTLVLEFGLLSFYTGNDVYFEVAQTALDRLIERRSPINLVGNTINVLTGQWMSGISGIGAGIDSLYEYQLKAAIMFDNSHFYDQFEMMYHSIQQFLKIGPYYIEGDMMTGQAIHLQFQSLQAFWPGLQTLIGDMDQAIDTFDAFLSIWRAYQSLPERYDLINQQVHSSERYYPLRPELIESAYYLYRATRDPRYQQVGREIYHDLMEHTKAKYGFASLIDVESKRREDHMNSFFLSETCKYLYLLFDEDHWLHNPLMNLSDARSQSVNQSVVTDYIFTTEGHLFPIRRDIQKRFGDDSKWARSVNQSINQPISPSLNHAICPFFDRLSVHLSRNEFYRLAHHALFKVEETVYDQCDINQPVPQQHHQSINQLSDLHSLDPNQLQDMIQRAFKQQQLMPNNQPINPLFNQQPNQQVHQAGDFVVRTGAGVFLIDRTSTGESLEARSLGGPVVELLNVYHEQSVNQHAKLDHTEYQVIDDDDTIKQPINTIIHSAVITPKGAFEYFVELIDHVDHEKPIMPTDDQLVEQAIDLQVIDHLTITSINHSNDSLHIEQGASINSEVVEPVSHRSDRSVIRAAGSYFGPAGPPGITHEWINHVPHITINDDSNQPIDDTLELISGEIIESHTPLLCPGDQPIDSSTYHGKIVLVNRGICAFVEKVLIAETAGAVGVLIINQSNDGHSNRLFTLGYGTDDHEPAIPAFMIGKDAGARLQDMIHSVNQSHGVHVRMIRQRIDQQPINQTLHQALHVHGNPSFITIRAIGGAVIEIEEGPGKTFHLRIKD